MRRRGRRIIGGSSSAATNHKELIYGSLSELVAAALGPCQMPLDTRSSHKDSGITWDGGYDFNAAVNLVIDGDMVGARRLAPAVLSGATALMSKVEERNDPFYALDGGISIDVARYLSGEPECWLDMAVGTFNKPAVTVLINPSIGGKSSSKTIDKIGENIGATILGLQALGYAVTVYAANKCGGARNSSYELFVAAPINPGGGPLDIALMSAVLRPCFLRRILFSIRECALDTQWRAAMGVEVNGGYGFAKTLNPNDARRITNAERVVTIDVQEFTGAPTAIKESVMSQLGGSK